MDLGGVETLIMNIYRKIDREKLQFDFLCHNRVESKFESEIKALGGRMYCVPGMSHVGFFGYLRRLHEFFVAHPEYHTVHTHQTDLNGLILWQAKRAGVPNRFSHSHIAFKCKKLKSKLIRAFFLSFIGWNTTRAFACSKLAGELVYKGKLKKNFTFIPNAIDTTVFRYDAQRAMAKRQELGLDANAPVIGHIGRFMRQKNHLFLIRVFAELLKQEPQATLLLIGVGARMEAVKEKAQQLGIEQHVKFLGSRTDVPDLMQAMDLFLFPSFFEGFSVATIEAQAAGLPLLTSTGVTSETSITDLVRRMPLSESPDHWARTALEMIQMHRQDDRRRYAEIVKEKGFDIAKLAETMQNLYLSAESASR